MKVFFTAVSSEPNGNKETHTPQPSYSVTSAIADFTESTTDAGTNIVYKAAYYCYNTAT